jgi:hypothetical protein
MSVVKMWAKALGPVVLLVAACSTSEQGTIEYRLDRPSDLAYGCIGARIDGGPDQALPLAACGLMITEDGGLAAPKGKSLVGFAVESTRGEVAVASFRTGDVLDSDPLTPGSSGITVGRLPISAATLPDGCFAVVANAGSCDLSRLDVLKAVRSGSLGESGFEKSSVRVPIANAGGAPLAAAPEMVATLPSAAAATSACGDPAGKLYVSLPRCHAVAALDAATGQILQTVRFGDGVAGVIAGGDLTCPIDCADVGGAQAAAPGPGGEPGALAVDPTGTRLFIGLRNRSTLTVVDLGADGSFAAVSEVALEKAVGLRRLAASADIAMGNGGLSGVHRFVYGLALDNSIRVVDVTSGQIPTECDTQVEPRLIRDLNDLSRIPCFPVGGAMTPARRRSAKGPGIELPGGAVGFDLAFLSGDNERTKTDTGGDISPTSLNGTFVVVTARDQVNRGVAFVITVDDDNAEDLEASGDPGKVDLALALPHQLRDAVRERLHASQVKCAANDPIFDQRAQGPVRVMDVRFAPELAFNLNASVDKSVYTPGQELRGVTLRSGRTVRLNPLLHLEVCEVRDSDEVTQNDPKNDRFVFMGSAHDDAGRREYAFPDVRNAPGELWTVSWEGVLAATDLDAIRAGGVVAVSPPDLTMSLSDLSGRFCELGVEPRDIVQLGCEVDAECALDETCYIHPDAPAGVKGLCLFTKDLDRLAQECRPLLISQRRYLVSAAPGQIRADSLRLGLKPFVLRSTPVGGCSSAGQCKALHDYEQKELEEATGISQPRSDRWACAPDVNLGGPPQCLATCERDEQCPVGSVCQDLICVEGAFAPQACLASVQQYEVHAGNAFTVVGAASGYLHNRILDLPSGECVVDPAANPLRVGRFRTNEPACESAPGGDPNYGGRAGGGPNPCSITLAEPMAVIENDVPEPGVRQSRGIRIRMPGMTLLVADVLTLHPGADALFDGILQAAYPLGFFWQFIVGGGVAPRADALGAGFPERIRQAPDGSLWIVDSGDSIGAQNGIARGQLVNFTQFGPVTNAIQ